MRISSLTQMCAFFVNKVVSILSTQHLQKSSQKVQTQSSSQIKIETQAKKLDRTGPMFTKSFRFAISSAASLSTFL
jgi:hypothetical protein